jgi:ankyrin repeat protein
MMKDASDQKDFVKKRGFVYRGKVVDAVYMSVILTRAMTGNDPSKALDLLKKYSIIDPSKNNNWALRIASKKGYLSIVAHLLNDSRVDPSAEHSIAIREASYHGHADIVELLLKDGRADPTSCDNHAFKCAIINKHIKVAELLLADPKGRVKTYEFRDWMNKNAYYVASYENFITMKGASDQKNFAEEYGVMFQGKAVSAENMFAIFATAMFDGRPSEALDLLKNFSIIDPSKNNNWAFRIACIRGYSNIVAHLLTDERTNPSAKDNEAICEASIRGYARIVELLLKDGRADPTVDIRYPLRLASQNGHVKVVELLLADPRINPPELNNPSIRQARRNGHTEIVFMFQEYFKNFNSKRGNIDNMKNSNSAEMRCIKMWYPDQEYYVSRTVRADTEVTIKYIFELFDLDPSITTLAYRDADAQNVRLSLDNDADIDEFNSFVKDGKPLIMKPLKKNQAKPKGEPWTPKKRVEGGDLIPVWAIFLSIFTVGIAVTTPFFLSIALLFPVVLYWVRKTCVKEFFRDFFDDKKHATEPVVRPQTSNVRIPLTYADKYAEELQTLNSLGFTKESRNTKYLKKYDGNLNKTIAALLK